MTNQLTREKRACVEKRVSSGEFASLEEAAASAISDTMQSENDDLGWARPLVDQARASVERGQFVSHDEFKQLLAQVRGKLG